MTGTWGQRAGALGGGTCGAGKAGRSSPRPPGGHCTGLSPPSHAAFGGCRPGSGLTVPGGGLAVPGGGLAVPGRASHLPARLSPQVLLSGLIGVVSWKRPLSLVVSGTRPCSGLGAGLCPQRYECPGGHAKRSRLLGGRGADLSRRLGARGWRVQVAGAEHFAGPLL